MSLIAIALNLILCLLLVCALAYGVRLERRLKAIRDGQLAFGKAVTELNMATERARAGLAELRGATDESTDMLGGRISRAREVADRLDRLVSRAEITPQVQAAPVSTLAAARPPVRAQSPAFAPSVETGPEGGLAALLARLKAIEETPADFLPQRAEAPLRTFKTASNF